MHDLNRHATQQAVSSTAVLSGDGPTVRPLLSAVALLVPGVVVGPLGTVFRLSSNAVKLPRHASFTQPILPSTAVVD